MNGRSDGIQVTWPLYRAGSFPEKFVPESFERLLPFPEHLKVNGYYRQGFKAMRRFYPTMTPSPILSREPRLEATSDEGGFAALISEDALVVTYNDSGFGSPARGKVSLDQGVVELVSVLDLEPLRESGSTTV